MQGCTQGGGGMQVSARRQRRRRQVLPGCGWMLGLPHLADAHPGPTPPRPRRPVTGDRSLHPGPELPTPKGMGSPNMSQPS
jgi:hypothetical protein